MSHYALIILLIPTIWIEVLKKAENTYHKQPTSNITDIKSHNYPDIYVFVLDSYPNDYILKNYYNFDNSQFTNFLKKNKFHIIPKSTSNYGYTHLSMPSFFNMNYIQSLSNPFPTNYPLKILNRLMKTSKVIKFIQNKGYTFINFNSGAGVSNKKNNADIHYPRDSYEFLSLCIRRSIFSSMTDSLGVKKAERKRKLQTFQQLSTIPSLKLKKPKFVLSHMILPHPPYLFGENGEIVPEAKLQFDGSAWLQKKLFINQTIFLNTKMERLIRDIITKSENPPVILIVGDHGPFSMIIRDLKDKKTTHSNDAYFEKFGNLNAVLIPNNTYEKYKNVHSLVNTFRQLFNELFDAEFPLLEDKIYYSPPKDSHNFTDVSQSIKTFR